MSYEQAIRHSRSLRKDRFVQQCSGYFGDGKPKDCKVLEVVFAEISATRMTKVLETAAEFPIYLYQQETGEWVLVPKNHLFGSEISSYEDLVKFATDYA